MAAPDHTPARRIAPGSSGFTVVLSMAMATTALGIDTVLPAFSDIRTDLGLESDSTAVAGLVTTFLLGSGLGLMPAGLLADRYGRRPIMWAGLALYVVGAVAAALAPSLWLMLIARFVWGLGSAGPRVAAMAMVRDAYEGAQMARQMSFIMAVFLLVPTVAPALGAGLIAIGPWQLVFWICAAAGVVVFGLTTRLPATLPTDERRALAASDVWQSCRTVLVAPGSVGFLIALTAMFGAFFSYLASSEIIVDEVFGLDAWFPAVFGGLAIVMGATSVVNGRIVERVGLETLTARVLVAMIGVTGVLVVIAFVADGRPPFWLFVVVFALVLACHMALGPNLNSAAMRPLGAVAGTAAAILGMVPMVVGSLLGNVIDRLYDGTMTPLAIGFFAASLIAFVASRWALRAAATTPSGAQLATAS